MKNFKLFLGLTLITMLLTTSCSKDDDTSSSVQKNLQKSWTKDKVERRINDGAWQDITVSCNLDDIEEYQSNSDWTLFPGTNTCDSESVTTGSWSLRANDTKIIYTYDSFSGEYESTIETITENVLILTQNTGDLNNTQFRFTYSKLE
jgi:hypothetical protein